MTQPRIDDVRKALTVPPGEPFNLAARPTRHPEIFLDKKEARISLETDAAAIDELQDKLYATRTHALLVVLQGMDTSGKSGVIRHVFAATSPLGIQVRSFKAPSDLELAHDYLWRVHQAVPRRGHIGIFDRSHYEDVLVVKVHGLAPAADIERRYDQINAFERHLTENRVKIVKFMLNMSYEAQGARLRDRLAEPHKRWKFNPKDLEDRGRWANFMDAYQIAVERCSTPHAPWYVVPADSRTRRNAMIARIVRGALEELDPAWPDPGFKADDYRFD